MADYRQSRNRVDALIRKSRKEYYQEAIDQAKGISKAMLNVLKTALDQKGPKVTVLKIQAEDINQHFTDVGVKNQTSVSYNKPDYMPTVASKFVLQEFSYDIVYSSLNLLKDINTLDVLGMYPKLLKCCSDLIAPIWTDIFNASLELGMVPDLLKRARVTPVFKQKGSRDDLSNNWPISWHHMLQKFLKKV